MSLAVAVSVSFGAFWVIFAIVEIIDWALDRIIDRALDRDA